MSDTSASSLSRSIGFATAASPHGPLDSTKTLPVRRSRHPIHSALQDPASSNSLSESGCLSGRAVACVLRFGHRLLQQWPRGSIPNRIAFTHRHALKQHHNVGLYVSPCRFITRSASTLAYFLMWNAGSARPHTILLHKHSLCPG